MPVRPVVFLALCRGRAVGSPRALNAGAQTACGDTAGWVRLRISPLSLARVRDRVVARFGAYSAWTRRDAPNDAASALDPTRDRSISVSHKSRADIPSQIRRDDNLALSPSVGEGHGQSKPEQLEIERLRREVAKLRAERDILKKAAAFFAREAR